MKYPLRTVAALAGTGLAAYGIVGLVGSTHTHSLISAIEWFVGGALTHDLVLAPVVIALGALLTRLVPASMRPYVQAGLFITAALTLVALPFLLGWGYHASNPSALPLNYGRGYGIAVGCVWALIALTAWLRSRRRAR
jgi:hypothetical protein